MGIPFALKGAAAHLVNVGGDDSTQWDHLAEPVVTTQLHPELLPQAFTAPETVTRQSDNVLVDLIVGTYSCDARAYSAATTLSALSPSA